MNAEYITRAQLLLQYFDALAQLSQEERAQQRKAAGCLPEMLPISESAAQVAVQA